MADTSSNRKALQIELTGTTEGLGITTVSGHNPNKPGEGSGIYIKDILTGRLAHKNGFLKIGDQLLQANDESLVGISNERAVEILRFCAATDSISLLIARDEIAQAEYQRLSIPNKEQSDYQPVKRSRHSTVKIGDHLYMWGGVGSRIHYDVIEMYHLPTGAWDQKPTTGTPPPGTWDYSSVAIGKDIYYFGGFGNGFHNNVHCINVDSFNWRELSPSSSDHSPMMKANCAMVLAHFDGEDYLIIFGGSRGSYSINTPKQPDAQYSADGRCNEIHYYRILSDQWISPVVTGDRPPPISHFTLTLVTNNTAVMFGGSTYNGASNKLYLISFTKTSVDILEVPNPGGSVQWPKGRWGHSSVLITNSLGPHLLVVGGRSVSDVCLLDISKRNWKILINLPDNVTKRYDHSLSVWSVTPTTNWIIEFGGWTSYTDTAVIQLRYTSDNDWSTSVIPLDQYQDQLRRILSDLENLKEVQLIRGPLQESDREFYEEQLQREIKEKEQTQQDRDKEQQQLLQEKAI